MAASSNEGAAFSWQRQFEQKLAGMGYICVKTFKRLHGKKSQKSKNHMKHNTLRPVCVKHPEFEKGVKMTPLEMNSVKIQQNHSVIDLNRGEPSREQDPINNLIKSRY